MYEKFLALVSFVLFAAFLAILGIWVESWSLKIVLIITVLMCGYDFLRETVLLRRNDNGGRH